MSITPSNISVVTQLGQIFYPSALEAIGRIYNSLDDNTIVLPEFLSKVLSLQIINLSTTSLGVNYGSNSFVINPGGGGLINYSGLQEIETVIFVGSTDSTYTFQEPLQVVGNVVSITDEGIGNNKIATDAIEQRNILDAAVSVGKLRVDSVATNRIIDLDVTTAKIADLAVTRAKIADGAVDFLKLDDVSPLTLMGNYTSTRGPVKSISLGNNLTFNTSNQLDTLSTIKGMQYLQANQVSNDYSNLNTGNLDYVIWVSIANSTVILPSTLSIKPGIFYVYARSVNNVLVKTSSGSVTTILTNQSVQCIYPTQNSYPSFFLSNNVSYGTQDWCNVDGNTGNIVGGNNSGVITAASKSGTTYNLTTSRSLICVNVSGFSANINIVIFTSVLLQINNPSSQDFYLMFIV